VTLRNDALIRTHFDLAISGAIANATLLAAEKLMFGMIGWPGTYAETRADEK
jgi:hypothetical protein